MPAAASYVLAVALGLAVVIWVGSRAGKPHRPIVPRFLRGTPVALQGGIAGHAAVIGAPGTSRVLAMLELKSALEEGMSALLALDSPPGSDALLLKLEAARLLPHEDLRALKALLLRLSNVETASLSRQHLPRGDQPGFRAGPGKIRDREVLSVAKTVERLLATARAAAKSSAA